MKNPSDNFYGRRGTPNQIVVDAAGWAALLEHDWDTVSGKSATVVIQFGTTPRGDHRLGFSAYCHDDRSVITECYYDIEDAGKTYGLARDFLDSVGEFSAAYPLWAEVIEDKPDPTFDSADRRIVTVDIEWDRDDEEGSPLELGLITRVVVPVWDDHTGHTLEHKLHDVAPASWRYTAATTLTATL